MKVDFHFPNDNAVLVEWRTNVCETVLCHTSVAFLKHHRESFLLIKMAIDLFTLLPAVDKLINNWINSYMEDTSLTGIACVSPNYREQ